MTSAEARTEVPRHLFFELENLAVEGREIMFEALKDTLETKGVELTVERYVRHGLYPLPEFAIPEILKAAGERADHTKRLEDQVRAQVRERIEGAALNSELVNVLDAAAELDVQPVTLSAFPPDVAGSWMQKLGLEERGVRLFAFEDVRPDFPQVKTWLTIVREEGIPARACMALTTSSRACKAALTTDMTAVAVPDRFTAFQDFSGARFVLEKLSDMKPRELLESTLPARTF